MNDTVAKLTAELTKAVLAGDMEKATQLSTIIANLKQTTEELNEVMEEIEVPVDVQEEEPATLAGVDDME